VVEQAEVAVELADAVLFVVDATVGATDTDEAVVRLLRRAGKPVVLAANKVDDAAGEATPPLLWSLGSASRTRSPRCTAGERRPARRLPRRAAADLRRSAART
jgi:predicted GTPase